MHLLASLERRSASPVSITVTVRRAEVWPDVGLWKMTVHRCSTAVSGAGSLVPRDVVVTGGSAESVEHDVPTGDEKATATSSAKA